MKKIRRVLVLFLCIVFILFSVSYLLPRKAYVERSILINASPNSIFTNVASLKNWAKWSPWFSNEKMNISYSGPESGIGSSMCWTSNDKSIDKGKISVISCTASDSILLILDFGSKGKMLSKFTFRKKEQATMVVWSVESDLGRNPVSRWLGLMISKMVGPDLEKGLQKLQEFTIANKTVNRFEITECEVPGRVVLAVHDTASPVNLSKKLSACFSSVSNFLKSRNISPTGSPFTIYNVYSDQFFDFQACIPIHETVNTSAGLSCLQMGNQKAVMITYFGQYNSISVAYKEIQSYIKDKGLTVNGSSWEEYVSDPSVVMDSIKWQTNIYFPVE